MTDCDGTLSYGAMPAADTGNFGADGNYKICVKLTDALGHTSFGASSTIQLKTVFSYSHDDNGSSEFGHAGILFDNTELANGDLRLQSWSNSQKELPNSEGSGLGFSMSGNELLLHFNGTLGFVGDGATILDSSGELLHGLADDSNGDMAFVAGQLNQSISFDGVNDFIELDYGGISGNLAANKDLTQITFMAWVNSSATNRIQTIYSLGANADGLSIGILSNGQYICGMAKNSVGRGMTSDTAQAANAWHFVACVLTATHSYLFIDGRIVASTLGGLTLNTGTCNQTVGADCPSGVALFGGSFPEYFTGKIDELAVFSRGLSEAEVQAIYRRQVGTYGGGQGGSVTSQILPNPGLGAGLLTNLNWVPEAPYLKSQPVGSTSESAYATDNYGAALRSNQNGVFTFDAPLGSVTNGATISNGAAGSSLHASVVNTDSTGLAFTDGKIAQALSFDGHDDCLELGAGTNWFGADDSITVSAWFKTTTAFDSTVDAVGGRIFNIFKSSDGTLWSKFVLGFWGDGTDTIFLYLRSAGVSFPLKGFHTRYYDGQWHHLVGRYDAGTDIAEIFFDGKSYNSMNAGQLEATGTDIAKIGCQVSSATGVNSGHFEGQLDDLGTWSRALSNDEIAQLYRRGAMNLRLQVRSCTQANCSDNPSFVGPDNTAATFFSELLNPSLGLPSLSLSPDLSLNPYMQYKVYFDNQTESSTPVLRGIQLDGTL